MVFLLQIKKLDPTFGQEKEAVGGLATVTSEMMQGTDQLRYLQRPLNHARPQITTVASDLCPLTTVHTRFISTPD
jgi:hypothetical protein